MIIRIHLRFSKSIKDFITNYFEIFFGEYLHFKLTKVFLGILKYGLICYKNIFKEVFIR